MSTPTFTARTRLKLLLGGAATLGLSSCGGSDSALPTVPVTSGPTSPLPAVFNPAPGQFRNTFRGKFDVGAAVQTFQISRNTVDSRLLKTQFNSLTAEYEMKANIIAPTEGAYDWSAPDALVDYAQANNLRIRGHALLWHESTPDWFLAGTPEQVKARLQTYITDVMTRYRGKIYAWDVVNEVITDDDFAEGPYRRSNWWDASGGNADYIDWAFEAARAADPDCQLFINDYATEQAGKLGRYVEVINDLTSRNIPLDGVGHQFHLNVDTLSANVLRALDRVDAQFLGLDQHVTELDISLYNDPGSCWETETNCDADYAGNVPDAVTRLQTQLFRDVFNGFAARPSVTSVSTWGISDPQSWLNTLPTRRTNAPLLWDNLRLAKPALRAILDPNYVI